MSRLGIFIADGCEEVEALTVVDIVRRAKLEIDMISINGTKQVTSSRNVTFMTDTIKRRLTFPLMTGSFCRVVCRERFIWEKMIRSVR